MKLFDEMKTLEDYKNELRKIMSDDLIAVYFDMIERSISTELFDNIIRDAMFDMNIDVCWSTTNCNKVNGCLSCSNSFLSAMKTEVLKNKSKVKWITFSIQNSDDTLHKLDVKKAEEKVALKNDKDFWYNISVKADKQRNKGIDTYGMKLEDNTSLSAIERIEYLQEELIDGLMYCEWLIDCIKKGKLN